MKSIALFFAMSMVCLAVVFPISISAGDMIMAENMTDSCKFTIGGRNYDLWQLSGEYHTNGTNGFSYEIDPCDFLLVDENPCGRRDLHGCQFNMNLGQSFVIGVNPIAAGASEGKVTVSYGGGDICPATGRSRELFITYRCGPELGYPYFLNEVHCNYYFDWETSLVC